MRLGPFTDTGILLPTTLAAIIVAAIIFALV